MPIRLNLLAEQQAAEDARRRDPVKRALWAGGGLVLLMLVWIASLQFRLISARAELNRYDSRLQSVEENSKEARVDWATSGQLENRLTNLQRYSTNRFYCANVLDALQQVMLDDVRVVQLQSVHSYATNAEVTVKTNLTFTIEEPRAWQFWKSRPQQTDVLLQISNQVAAITNRVEAFKAPVDLVTRIEVKTNRNQVTAQIEIRKPIASAEQVLLTIKARDYGNPAGKRVDEFSKAIAAHPYFAQRLQAGDGQGIRLRERAIQPELDQLDPVSPNRPFIPFVIECRYRETQRANE